MSYRRTEGSFFLLSTQYTTRNLPSLLTAPDFYCAHWEKLA